ncbi:R3H domain-containing protein 4-like [Uloborus diversus]|uniref:R3H domain-containing protein 4-like n=1 Tax=Uloborus diversus TaxID=327109 RepID=UPI002409A596|nr:R3H domain-containing protein 4-like [Uloborus diversus]
MGVIRKSNISESYSDSIEDVLNEIENNVQNQEPEVRRPRKIKHRSTKLLAVGDVSNTSGKSGKKKKRGDNSNYLLSLADPEEVQELSIQDFIPQNVSVFSQMFIYRDNIELWNEFINCTKNNEDWFQKHIGTENIDDSEQVMDENSDKRLDHPAYTAAECFHKIDGDLRNMLKKKHIPMGVLIHLEQELVTFFVNRPDSIYHCSIPNSYERLMVHALSQYMDLSSLSYNRSGSRWTRVKNKKPTFLLPPVLLSSFLEKRSTHTVH